MRTLLLSSTILLIATALTCVGAFASEESFTPYFVLAGIYLFMAITLAIPFECQPRRRPFWSAYATVAAYALVIRNTELDVFVYVPHYLLQQLLGDLSSMDSRPVARLLMYAVIWNPVWVGLIGGSIFAIVHRLWAPTENTG